jgi:hypothetical protein
MPFREGVYTRGGACWQVRNAGAGASGPCGECALCSAAASASVASRERIWYPAESRAADFAWPCPGGEGGGDVRNTVELRRR